VPLAPFHFVDRVGTRFSSQFAIILLYSRIEIPLGDQRSQMSRHPNTSRTPATLLVLLALLAQDASALQWNSPRTEDVISPGDMILAAWYASLGLMTTTVTNRALIG
jgi:hypothetical protein